MKQKSTTRTVTREKQELAKRIKALRGSTHQEVFAGYLGVGRTQVVAWESEEREEQPSARNLLKIANEIAQTAEDRAFFWSRAGVDLGKVQKDFNEQAKKRRKAASTTLETEQTVLPLIKGFRRGSFLPRMADCEYLPVPSRWVPNPRTTIAVEIGSAPRRLGKLPEPLGVGDLAIVDRSFIEPRDLIRCGAGGRPIAAIATPELPEYIKQGGEYVGGNSLPSPQDYTGGDPLVTQILVDFKSSTLLYGFLTEQLATEGVNEFPHDTPGGVTPFRLVLRVGSGVVIPLSNWVEGLNGDWPRDISKGPVLEGARIFGAVVGWLRAPESILGKDER